MITKVKAVFFSATGTTKKVVNEIAEGIAKKSNRPLEIADFTLPEARKKPLAFSAKELVVFGVPVYAGRVPNVLLPYLKTMEGNGALAVAVVVYGNRDYEDALVELQDILEEGGLKVVGAGAFIGEHSFSKTLAQGRPDADDIKVINDFAGKIYEKINSPEKLEPVAVKGNRPYRYYYFPRNEKGEKVDLRKIKPKTGESCTDCKLCAEICPMGSIVYEKVSEFSGICIKCGACVKRCPTQAKYFDDERYIKHKEELELMFAERKEPELFV